MKRREFLKISAAAGIASSIPLNVSAAGQMTTRSVPSTGTPLGVVGYGNSPVFYKDDEGNEAIAKELFGILKEFGGNFVDTNPVSVWNLGKWLSVETLRQFHITTGFTEAASTMTEKDLPAIQRILGKTPIDFLQIRNMRSTIATPKFWPILKEWKQEGIVKHIGVTGTRAAYYDVLEKAINDGADFIQIAYNFFEQGAEERMLPMAKDNGVAVITNRPFINGAYFPRVKDKKLPDWASEFDCQSWAQFSVKWILGNPDVTCVLTETSKPHHARDNLQSGVGRIPDQAMRKRMLEHIQAIS